jgi:hypothetical protein
MRTAPNLERLANLPRVILFAFEFEDRASRHDLEIRKLRERTDQTFREAIA